MRFRLCSLSSSIGNCWLLIFDKMEVRRDHLGGSVKHSEGKDEESVMAIPGFLCGSPSLCRLRTEGMVPVNKY
jgi:hypothetical protein